MNMQSHYNNPHWVNNLEALFAPSVKWIAVMNDRDCDTGLLVFGYPEKTYGYKTYTQLHYKDIPQLVELAERRGFELYGMHDDDNNPNAPESMVGKGGLGFTYRYPGAKWWTEFVQNVPTRVVTE